LLSGEVDLIDRLKLVQSANLEKETKIKTAKVLSMDNNYFHFKNNKVNDYIAPAKFGYADIRAITDGVLPAAKMGKMGKKKTCGLIKDS
jgi:hypothetical protein